MFALVVDAIGTFFSYFLFYCAITIPLALLQYALYPPHIQIEGAKHEILGRILVYGYVAWIIATVNLIYYLLGAWKFGIIFGTLSCASMLFGYVFFAPKFAAATKPKSQ